MLYFGPELMMPLASAAAAAAGAILMFWRRFVGGVKALARGVMRLFRKREEPPAPRTGTRRRRRAEGPSGSS